jgi:hypothetical protein
MLAKSIPSRFQWVQHCNSVHSTSLTRIHTTRARIAGSSQRRRRREDLECDITTTLCPGYRLERDYHQRPCLEAIPAAILQVILQVTLEAIPDMGPVQRMETAIRANRVDHQVDRNQYQCHRDANFESEHITPACALPPTRQFPSQLRRNRRHAKVWTVGGTNEHRRAKDTKPPENTQKDNFSRQ